MPTQPISSIPDIELPDSILKKLPSKELKAEAAKLAKEIQQKKIEIAKAKKLASMFNKRLSDLEPELIKNKAISDQAIKYAQVIARDCKFAVRAYQDTNLMLFRGIMNSPKAFVSYPRDDREPKDTAMHLHKGFNELMAKAGYEARRDNSIFCSPTSSTAEGYGDLYMIFPLDGFKYSWSDLYEDLTSNLLSSNKSMGEIILNAWKGEQHFYTLDHRIRELTDAIEDFDSSKQDPTEYFPRILQDIDNRNKIYTALTTLHRTAFYNRNIPDLVELRKWELLFAQFNTTDWYASTIRDIQEAIQELKLIHTHSAADTMLQLGSHKNTAFDGALKSGHEIYILGRYYAFRAMEYSDAFGKILFGRHIR